VTAGQLHYEMEHLRAKLRKCDKDRWAVCKDLDITTIQPHPCFAVVEGEVAEWEKNVTMTTTTKKVRTTTVVNKGTRKSKRVKKAAEGGGGKEEEEGGEEGESLLMSMIEKTTTTTMMTTVPDLMDEDSSSSSSSSSSSGKRKTRSAVTAERAAAAAPVIGTPQRVRRAGTKKAIPVRPERGSVGNENGTTLKIMRQGTK